MQQRRPAKTGADQPSVEDDPGKESGAKQANEQSLTAVMKYCAVLVGPLLCVIVCLVRVASNKGAIDKYDYADAKRAEFDRIADKEIETVVELLRTVDTQRAGADDVVLNLQGKTGPHDTDDVAPLPLFKYVNDSLLQLDTYRTLLSLVDIFKRDVHEPEQWDDAARARIDHFLQTMMATKPFALVWDFLVSKHLAPADAEQMKSLLYTLWFGLYSRAAGSYGSSGFEHVFFGEWNGHIVEGQHNWLRFYVLERKGEIDYKGYVDHKKNVITTIRYTWGKMTKHIGGFLVGTSPEFDFSIFTLCFLAKRGDRKCHYNIDAVPLKVTSFKIEKRPYIATTFPVC